MLSLYIGAHYFHLLVFISTNKQDFTIYFCKHFKLCHTSVFSNYFCTSTFGSPKNNFLFWSWLSSSPVLTSNILVEVILNFKAHPYRFFASTRMQITDRICQPRCNCGLDKGCANSSEATMSCEVLQEEVQKQYSNYLNSLNKSLYLF